MANPYKELIKTLEFPFCYYAYMIDREGLIDYFHYGLWETGTETLKEAQENLASMMKSFIPAGVKRILDVGCGLGKTTYDLTLAGYDVLGISPDIRLMEMAKVKHKECETKLIISFFEDYRSHDLFDLILFQESAQYIKDISFLFAHCKELLNKTGYLLMCDEICYENSNHCFYHVKSELVDNAHECGLNVVFNENITQKILMTRELGLRFLIENKNSIIHEFSSFRENARQEIELMMEGWNAGSKLYKENIFGYELFLFQNIETKTEKTIVKRLLNKLSDSFR